MKLLTLTLILTLACGGCKKQEEVYRPGYGIQCGGHTDANGITWDWRCKKGYGEACYDEEACYQPRICGECAAIIENNPYTPDKKFWCEDYTELYQELLKDDRRFNSLLIACPRCRGMGIIKHPSDWRFRDCYYCYGEGEVEECK